MIKPILLLAFAFIIPGLVCTSCISNKKFTASEAQVKKLQLDNASITAGLNECKMKAKSLQEENTMLQNANAAVIDDLKALSTRSKLTIADQAKEVGLEGAVSGILGGGVAKLAASPRQLVGSYPTVSPLPRTRHASAGRFAFCCAVRRSLPLGVTQRRAL